MAGASSVAYALPVMIEAAAPSFEDVLAASRRIAGQAHRTPVLRSGTADERVGAEVFFKCENFQRVGAFKFRGAFNALSRFDAAQRRAGVVLLVDGMRQVLRSAQGAGGCNTTAAGSAPAARFAAVGSGAF